MHYTALKHFKIFSQQYLQNKRLKVIDFGSFSVNGDLKKIIIQKHDYVGLDIEKGPNVDIIMKDPYKIPLKDSSTDVVISSSCFEHVEHFWFSFNEIIRVLKPSGLFYLNVPSNGDYHTYPLDCFRFYPDAGKALVSWGKKSGFKNLMLIESFIGRQQNDIWNDFVAIFIKDKKFINRYKNRMINRKSLKFNNGYLYNYNHIKKFQSRSEDQEYKTHPQYEQLKYTSRKEFYFYRHINKILKFVYRIK